MAGTDKAEKERGGKREGGREGGGEQPLPDASDQSRASLRRSFSLKNSLVSELLPSPQFPRNPIPPKNVSAENVSGSTLMNPPHGGSRPERSSGEADDGVEAAGGAGAASSAGTPPEGVFGADLGFGSLGGSGTMARGQDNEGGRVRGGHRRALEQSEGYRLSVSDDERSASKNADKLCKKVSQKIALDLASADLRESSRASRIAASASASVSVLASPMSVQTRTAPCLPSHTLPHTTQPPPSNRRRRSTVEGAGSEVRDSEPEFASESVTNAGIDAGIVAQVANIEAQAGIEPGGGPGTRGGVVADMIAETVEGGERGDSGSAGWLKLHPISGGGVEGEGVEGEGVERGAGDSRARESRAGPKEEFVQFFVAEELRGKTIQELDRILPNLRDLAFSSCCPNLKPGLLFRSARAFSGSYSEIQWALISTLGIKTVIDLRDENLAAIPEEAASRLLLSNFFAPFLAASERENDVKKLYEMPHLNPNQPATTTHPTTTTHTATHSILITPDPQSTAHPDTQFATSEGPARSEGSIESAQSGATSPSAAPSRRAALAEHFWRRRAPPSGSSSPAFLSQPVTSEHSDTFDPETRSTDPKALDGRESEKDSGKESEREREGKERREREREEQTSDGHDHGHGHGLREKSGAKSLVAKSLGAGLTAAGSATATRLWAFRKSLSPKSKTTTAPAAASEAVAPPIAPATSTSPAPVPAPALAPAVTPPAPTSRPGRWLSGGRALTPTLSETARTQIASRIQTFAARRRDIPEAVLDTMMPPRTLNLTTNPNPSPNPNPNSNADADLTSKSTTGAAGNTGAINPDIGICPVTPGTLNAAPQNAAAQTVATQGVAAQGLAPAPLAGLGDSFLLRYFLSKTKRKLVVLNVLDSPAVKRRILETVSGSPYLPIVVLAKAADKLTGTALAPFYFCKYIMSAHDIVASYYEMIDNCKLTIRVCV